MRFIDPRLDAWQAHDPAQPVAKPAQGVPARLLVALEDWLGLDLVRREALLREARVGLVVPNDADVQALEAELARVDLLVLQFPKWTDGRAYTQARLLRLRLRFGGELRATGQVLADMLLPLARSGFDAVQLREDQDLLDARRALEFFDGYYQADASWPGRHPGHFLGGAPGRSEAAPAAVHGASGAQGRQRACA